MRHPVPFRFILYFAMYFIAGITASELIKSSVNWLFLMIIIVTIFIGIFESLIARQLAGQEIEKLLRKEHIGFREMWFLLINDERTPHHQMVNSHLATCHFTCRDFEKYVSERIRQEKSRSRERSRIVPEED